MSKALGVHSQRLLGVINASPAGIFEETLLFLCDRPHFDSPDHDIKHAELRRRLGQMRRLGLCAKVDGVWYPTQTSSASLSKAAKPAVPPLDLTEEDGWLGGTAAARHLNISPRTLFKRAVNGEVPFTLDNRGHRRFHVKDLGPEADRGAVLSSAYGWVGITDAADFLGWSKTTVYKRAADGALPYEIDGLGRYRFHIDNLKELNVKAPTR